jgi:hypothetical protein
MIGKVVLVGVTRYGGDGQVQGLEQYAGTVLRISADEGVVLADEDDGHERYLPPMLDQYQRAEPGEYRMRNSGMIVVDPDYLTAWDLRPAVTTDHAWQVPAIAGLSGRATLPHPATSPSGPFTTSLRC